VVSALRNVPYLPSDGRPSEYLSYCSNWASDSWFCWIWYAMHPIYPTHSRVKTVNRKLKWAVSGRHVEFRFWRISRPKSPKFGRSLENGILTSWTVTINFQQNSRWRTAVTLKTVMSRELSCRLFDFAEIWYVNARLCFHIYEYRPIPWLLTQLLRTGR